MFISIWKNSTSISVSYSNISHFHEVFSANKLENHCWQWVQPWNWKTLAPWNGCYDKPRQCIKKQRHHFAKKGPCIQRYGFSSNHVWMWELDHQESWVLKNLCFWIVVLQKPLESSLDSKAIKPVNPKGNQPWIFIGRTEDWCRSSNTLATWCKDLTGWKKPWCWVTAKGEVGSRGWDG